MKFNTTGALHRKVISQKSPRVASLNQTIFSKRFSTPLFSRFVRVVMQYYKKHGRHDLPWRQTADPYKILVSEMMLQQTQVLRVVPKYDAFLKRFPNVETLAQAELSEVYELWQGLGYNRRARFLRDTARKVLEMSKAKLHSFPDTLEGLESLPGVGPYTARAVYTFAYNKPTVVIETNVRACVLHHFFPKAKKGQVSDRRIEKIMEACMRIVVKKKIQPREWYSALMDYGTFLKSTHVNPSRKSNMHVVQKKFKGSVREVRGFLLKLLAKNRHQIAVALRQQTIDSLQATKGKFEEALEGLIKDGMVVKMKKGEQDFLKLAS